MMKSREKYLLLLFILITSLLPFPAYGMIPVWNITNNGEYISDIAIRDDGLQLITGTMTGIATVYDQNGTVILKKQVPGTLMVGYQVNGSSFILGSNENIYSNKGVLRAYSDDGSDKWRVITGSIASLGIAGKSSRIVVGNREGEVFVLDEQGNVVSKFNDTPQTDVVTGISISDDGKVFVYTLEERYPRIRYVTIDTQKKRVFRQLSNESRTGHGGGEQITDIAISSDAKYIITSYGEGGHGALCFYGYNGTKIWGKDIGEIRDIEILPNGAAVFAGKADGDLLGYSRSGNLIFIYSTGSAVTSLSLAADKNLLAAGNAEGNLYLFNDVGNLLWTYQIEEFPVAEISRIDISRNGAAMAVLVNNKNIYFFRDESKLGTVEVKETPTIVIVRGTESSIPVLLVILSLLAVIVLARRQ